MIQNLPSYWALNPSRTFRKTGKKCAAVFGGSLGVPALTSSCQREKRRPKYCENDCSCGSPGLLGIGKCHKSQEWDCLCKFPSPHFRLQRFRCIFFFYVPEKQAGFGDTPLNQTQTPHLGDLSILQATKHATYF